MTRTKIRSPARRLRVAAALIALVAASLGATVRVEAKIVGKKVTYKAGKTTLKGFLAYDSAKKGKRPGVLVVHEWWGHNAYARRRARMLARLGYTALALDMYGDGKNTTHPDSARKFMMAVVSQMGVARARFAAAMKLLRAQPTVNPERIAAIGYCFGGGIVLQMARAGLDLRGVVSFHGSLGTKTPAKKGAVEAELLVLHGAADPFVKPQGIAQFKKEMKDAGVKLRFISYPGAKHAFTNPAATKMGKKNHLPLAYNAKADRASWAEMKRFLARVLRR